MRIIFFLISASLIFAADFELNDSSSLLERIVNEKSDEHKDFKFTASFRHKDVHFCTAGLLSNKHAVTTASCIKDFLIHPKIPDFDSYSIKAGESDTAEGLICFRIEEVQASRKHRYNTPRVEYDFGLVTLRNNDVESKYIGWAFWSRGTPISPAETFDVSVWRNTNGSTEINAKSQLTLKKISFEVMKKDSCGFRSDSPIICAKPIDENFTLSKEDIGTPLRGKHLIRGILASLPIDSEQFTIFVDLYYSYREMERLLDDRSHYFRSVLPRKKARFDAMIPFANRRAKRKYNHRVESVTQNSLDD